MNNEAEYEAMILAILVFKGIQVKRVVLHGDSEMIIKQMTGEYQARHPWMKIYWNDALYLIEWFEECNFNFIPILQNCIADSLATSTVNFKVPMHHGRKYEG